jgi:3-hydroxyacyl-CoA dehydrogenase
VLETIVEDLEAKQGLVRKLDSLLREAAIIASNTSYLDLNRIAETAAAPERVIGLHFFNPATAMPLVEVIEGDATAPSVTATALSLAKRLDKRPIVAGVGEGFVANRMFAAYRQHSEYLVLDGAAPRQVDLAMESIGFAMGPFAVADLSGLDIAWARRRRLAAEGPPRLRYVEIPDRLCEMGRLGRKAGRGYYDYTRNGRGADDPVTDTVIQDVRRLHGLAATDAPDHSTVVSRVLWAIVNEAAQLVSEGVARQPTDCDVAAVNGFSFPRHLGGPLWWAAQQSVDALERGLADVAAAEGPGHRRGPVHEILGEIRGTTGDAPVSR